jgi:predicted metal-dependent hydrolase
LGVLPTTRPTLAGSAEEAFVRGARLFDAGAFFAAHEAWEDHWRVEPDLPLRRFFQGFIQIAAGFHKLIVMKNPASAARLLAKGRAKLEVSPEGLASASLTEFCARVSACERALARGDAENSALAPPKLG